MIKNYIKTFSGLSKAVWWLALITLINRAGTMVIPFLSLYLKESLNFSLNQVGWVMSCFGMGSLIGAWLGGKLTDKIGHHKVMFTSLIATGLLFILLQYVTTFLGFCVSIFFLLIVADTFRPAMFVALNSYSKPKNKTRSVTLIRLAINLGFSAGPAVGGLIISKLGYEYLFWVDGITCTLASLLLLYTLNPKKSKPIDEEVTNNPISVYSDKPYFIFLIAMMLFGIVFLQYFSTIPLFYKDVHRLTESQIGLLMGGKGLLIFLLEMPLVKKLEDKKYPQINLMIIGGILLAISVLMLNLTSWVGIVIIGMIFMAIGEMIAFPFSNAFAMNRSKRGKKGEYMAMYTIVFSLAHIFGHNCSMQLIDKIGYTKTWYIIFTVAIASGFFMLWLKRIINK